jgi:hypothetical protein
MLGKAQSDALGHFNVPPGAVFHANDLGFVERLGTEIGHATVETTCHEGIVHAVNECGFVVNGDVDDVVDSKCSGVSETIQ